MVSEWTACVLRHRGDPRRAAPGLLLCRSHYDGLDGMLAGIAADWVLLAAALEPGPAANGRGRPVDPQAPLRLDVAALRDWRSLALVPGDPPGVPGVVGGWVRVVCEERSVRPPSPCGVVEAAGFLRRHLAWIAARPYADEVHGEVAEAAAALGRALGDEPPASVGRCAAPDDDGGECGGPLRVDRWGALAVECARCGDRWDEADLRRLGLVLGGGPQGG